jgi:peroxiredoxin Q/BCP
VTSLNETPEAAFAPPAKAALSFKLPGSDGKTHSLKDYKGRPVVLYFYPEDDTPTCTVEACEFRDAHKGFAKLDAVVLGISPDGLKAHDKFIRKFGLPFTLLADEGHKVTEAFGLWQQKTTFGRTYMGVRRATLLFGRDGKFKQGWIVTRAKGHAAAVLEAVKAL